MVCIINGYNSHDTPSRVVVLSFKRDRCADHHASLCRHVVRRRSICPHILSHSAYRSSTRMTKNYQEKPNNKVSRRAAYRRCGIGLGCSKVSLPGTLNSLRYYRSMHDTLRLHIE